MVWGLPPGWDEVFDVIVVGAGTAGLPAARAAKMAGADVVVIEQMPTPAGSGTRMAGWINIAGTEVQEQRGIKDSPERWFKDFIEVCKPENVEVVREYCRVNPRIYPFLKAYGVRCLGLEHTPGSSIPRAHVYIGSEVMAGVHKAAQEAGVPIRFKQKVVDIYRDPVSKRVVGVRVRVRRGEYRDLRARKAVIVATGGCLNNPRLIWEYGSWKHAQFCVPEARGHTGEMYGILFKIGVPIRYPGTLIYASTPLDYYTRAPHTYLAFFSWAGAILVNSEGKRFVNEDAILFPVLGEACFAQPEAVSFAIFDQKILDEIKRRSPHVPLNNFNIFKADTLEGLAKELGISAENLVKEVKEFNDDIKKYGYDKKFGTRIRIMYDEPLVPIDTPPFYGVKCVAGLTSTRGGVFINTRGQVLDGDNNVVPGLYAAGELSTGGFFRDGMYICGTHMSICLAYGPVVGENAARLG